MTSPVSPSETIAKALEGVTAEEWIVNGDRFSVETNATYIPDQKVIALCATGEGAMARSLYIASCNPVAMREVLDELYALRETALKLEAMQRRAEDAEALAERLKLEAQAHAMEASTANSTINEIYQVVSGGNGEPGNWHGATPVREKLEAMQREMAELHAMLERCAPAEQSKSWLPIPLWQDARTLIQGEKK